MIEFQGKLREREMMKGLVRNYRSLERKLLILLNFFAGDPDGFSLYYCREGK